MEPIRTYRRYVLFIATLVYSLSYLDQNAMLLMVEPIKESLRLSDTQLGIVTGIGFGLFYATLGLPIARWADRADRTTVASLAVGLWGLTVMSCLFVTNFVHLVAARLAAGVGGSGCMPPTYSLLGDYFPGASERTRAMTVYMLASSLAILISFIVGGWLNDLYGWRITFFVLGSPGLLAALLVKTTIVEPRAHSLSPVAEDHPAPPLRRVLSSFWGKRAGRHLSFALGALYVFMSGMGPWYAAFMIRSHGMGTRELGTWLGSIFGICGIAGTLSGGYIAAHAFPADEAAQMRFTAVVTAALVPCSALFLLLPGKWQALAGLVPLIVALNFFLGPTFALMQRLVRAEERATIAAVVLLFVNLIGMGLGPAIVGILSDRLRTYAATDSLRYAMLILSSIALWAAWHFWEVGRTVKEDLTAVAGDCHMAVH